MIPNQLTYLLNGIIVKLKPAHNVFRHPGTHRFMTIKMRHTFLFGHYLWFANIMEQHGEPQHFIRIHISKRMQDMFPYIITMMGMPLLRCHCPVKFGKEYFGHAAEISGTEIIRMGRQKHFNQFRLYSLRTDSIQSMRKDFYRFQCPLIHIISQLSSKANGPHHTKGVFLKTFSGISHTTHNARLHVIHTAEQIHQSPLMIIGHCVDGEISALQVFFQVGRKYYLFGVPAVLIYPVHTISRHLKPFSAQHDRNRPMLKPCINRPGKQCFRLFRPCGSGNIPIHWFSSQNKVPHTSSHHISFITGICNGIYNIFCLFGHFYPHVLFHT